MKPGDIVRTRGTAITPESLGMYLGTIEVDPYPVRYVVYVVETGEKRNFLAGHLEVVCVTDSYCS